MSLTFLNSRLSSWNWKVNYILTHPRNYVISWNNKLVLEKLELELLKNRKRDRTPENFRLNTFSNILVLLPRIFHKQKWSNLINIKFNKLNRRWATKRNCEVNICIIKMSFYYGKFSKYFYWKYPYFPETI